MSFVFIVGKDATDDGHDAAAASATAAGVKQDIKLDIIREVLIEQNIVI